MIKKVLFIGVCIFAFASCGTVEPLYSWYNYEDITYQYSKKSTEELQVKVLEQYQKMIDKQKVPEGLFLLACMQNTDTCCIVQERKRKDCLS